MIKEQRKNKVCPRMTCLLRILSPACVPPQFWTPLSSGPAPRCLVSSSSCALMMSWALLPARVPLATLDFTAATANSSIVRTDPFETLCLAYTGGPSTSSSRAGTPRRTPHAYGKAAALAGVLVGRGHGLFAQVFCAKF